MARVVTATIALFCEAALTLEWLPISIPTELLLALTPRLTPVVEITVKLPVQALLLALFVVLPSTLGSSGNESRAVTIVAVVIAGIVEANCSGFMCPDFYLPPRVRLLELLEHLLDLFDDVVEHYDVFRLKHDAYVVGTIDNAARTHHFEISSCRSDMADLRGQRACEGCIVQLRGNEVDAGILFLRIKS